ncbi:MAG: DNA (cytosine-5-)-methyltransferase [Mycoplasmatales bacterium]|nr:DNA (cytosine-5-)-methyltransferase [Mycoplasmatales bacterium]
MNKKDIEVVELFAGVGGFRLGLEKTSNSFKTIWANQWEPSTQAQHAADVYQEHWNDGTLVNEDISLVWENVPKHDLLVGGFPCQDYSVAQTKAKGIQGKKGVLWWEIYKIVKKNKPSMILLENVDRLLKSPVNQRGRDFAIMLSSLNELGYIVEWRTINAADYGFPQKRKRVFIFARKSNSKKTPTKKFIEKESIFRNEFPVETFYDSKQIDLNKYEDLIDITQKYKEGKFAESGVSIKGKVFHTKYKASLSKQTPFKDILDKNQKNYKFLTDKQREIAAYQKSSKRIERQSKETGFKYLYSEGKMSYPEVMELPGRTMLTSEGTINRSSHFIKSGKGIRFMTPIEAERMNGFDDNWTSSKHDRFRYFAMGNALVVGIISKIGKEIIKNVK